MPQHTTPSRRKRRRRLARRGYATLLAVALAVVVGGAVLAAGGLTRLALDTAGLVTGRFQPKNVGPIVRVQPQEPFSVLVLGTETAPGYAGPELTDSMMVMTFDPRSKQASVLSVPRDLWVNVPGFGPQRINTAYENGGPSTAALAVEKYIGVPIEYYAVVDYPALVTLVNDVGGINVTVPYNINDKCYPNVQENKCTTFKLAAGSYHMNGALALKFARERHSFADGDIQRQRDQQIVLLALKQALLRPRNILHLPKIIGDMEALVKTNIPYADIPTLAAEVLHVNLAQMRHGVLDYRSGAVTNYTTSGGAMVLLPHAHVIAGIVHQTFGGVLGHMGKFSVQVENGAPTTQDLATYFSGVLDRMGVQTLTPEQAARTDHAHNHVYVNTAVLHLGRAPLPTEAVMLGQMLGSQATLRRFASSRAQIVVVLGSAFPRVVPRG